MIDKKFLESYANTAIKIKKDPHIKEGDVLWLYIRNNETPKIDELELLNDFHDDLEEILHKHNITWKPASLPESIQQASIFYGSVVGCLINYEENVIVGGMAGGSIIFSAIQGWNQFINYIGLEKPVSKLIEFYSKKLIKPKVDYKVDGNLLTITTLQKD